MTTSNPDPLAAPREETMDRMTNSGHPREKDMPSVGEIYDCNHGTGRMQAQVVRVTDDGVTLVRVGARRATRWSLPLRFFLHPVCGWSLAEKADDSLRRGQGKGEA